MNESQPNQHALPAQETFAASESPIESELPGGESGQARAVQSTKTVLDFRGRLARVRNQISDLKKYYRGHSVTDPAVAVDLVRLLAGAGAASATLQRPVEAMSERIAWAMLNDPVARVELEELWDSV